MHIFHKWETLKSGHGILKKRIRNLRVRDEPFIAYLQKCKCGKKRCLIERIDGTRIVLNFAFYQHLEVKEF